MKSKGAPNLYEILKSETVRGKAAEPVPVRIAESPGPATLELPPSPPVKAEAPAPVEPLPPPPPRVDVAPLRPLVRALPPPKPVVTGPGERSVTITYNTAGFLILIVIGMLFVAYSLGVRNGRAAAATQVSETERGPALLEERPGGGAPAPAPAPQPAALFSIFLMEWKGATNREMAEGESLALKMKELLASRGHREAWVRFDEPRKMWMLYYGRYTREQESAARDDCEKLRAFKLRRGDGTSYAPFPRCDAVTISN